MDSYFKRGVKLSPHSSHTFKNPSVLNYYHINNSKQGLIYFSRSLILDPNQPEADNPRIAGTPLGSPTSDKVDD